MKMLSIRFMIPFCFFLGLCGLLWKALFLDPNELPSVLIGKPAPQFRLASVKAPHHFFTEKIFKGHITLLNIWATWCITCKEEHSIWMNIMAGQAKEKQLENVVLVGLNYHDTLSNVQKWLKLAGDPYYLTLIDPEDRIEIDYGVCGTPETFVIDKEGIIRYRHVGSMSLAVWQQKLLPLICDLQK